MMNPGEHESGFRRLPRFQRALLAADVARLCGDWPAAWTPPPEGFDEPAVIEAARRHLAALKVISARLESITRSRRAFLDLAPDDVRFAAGADVRDPEARLCAVVARAYARADAVAWSEAAGAEDDVELEAFARHAAEFLPHLERFRVVGRHALVRRRYADEEKRRWWYECAEGAFEDLTALAEAARATSSRNSAPGRRRGVARKFFIHRLAGIYALTTGMRPPLSGGNVGAAYDDHGENKRTPNPWHGLINAALGLTGIGGDASTDSILRDAAGDEWAVSRIEDLADGEWSRPEGRWRLEYTQLPGVDIESEIGLSPDAPMSREEAYTHPGTYHTGRTGQG
ncbi:MAG: hypothetical protein OEL76_17800 [Siculibacillus sp.]|nr:hypothetical protein [Siculibacillus sp.]